MYVQLRVLSCDMPDQEQSPCAQLRQEKPVTRPRLAE